MLSFHLLFYRPLLLFPVLGYHNVRCFVHLLSSFLASSLTLVLLLIAEFLTLSWTELVIVWKKVHICIKNCTHDLLCGVFILVKGTSHQIFRSGTPINHFQKHGKIHINQKKQKIPLKLMKEMGFFASSVLWGTHQCFEFPKILVLLCVLHLKEEKYGFWKSK